MIFLLGLSLLIMQSNPKTKCLAIERMATWIGFFLQTLASSPELRHRNHDLNPRLWKRGRKSSGFGGEGGSFCRDPTRILIPQKNRERKNHQKPSRVDDEHSQNKCTTISSIGRNSSSSLAPVAKKKHECPCSKDVDEFTSCSTRAGERPRE